MVIVIALVTPTSKRGSGKRGRPKGSTGVPRRSRGRGGVRKSLSAAELAGAQAGMTAAYAAYGYNIAGNGKTMQWHKGQFPVVF